VSRDDSEMEKRKGATSTTGRRVAETRLNSEMANFYFSNDDRKNERPRAVKRHEGDKRDTHVSSFALLHRRVMLEPQPPCPTANVTVVRTRALVSREDSRWTRRAYTEQRRTRAHNSTAPRRRGAARWLASKTSATVLLLFDVEMRDRANEPVNRGTAAWHGDRERNSALTAL